MAVTQNSGWARACLFGSVATACVIESKTDKGRLKHILSDGLSFFKNLPHRKMPAFLLRQFGLFQSISSQLADSLIASVAWAMPTKK